MSEDVTLMDCMTPKEVLHILEACVERGGMESEKAEFVRERYEGAYAQVRHSIEADKILHLEEKHLQRQLEMEEKLHEEGIEEEDAAMRALREELRQMHVKALVVVQKEESLNEEIQELTEEKLDAEFRWQESKDAEKRELVPIMEQLKIDVSETENERAIESEKRTKAEEDIRKIQDAVHSCQIQMEELKKERDDAALRLNRVKNEPSKRKRQNEAIEAVLKGLQNRCSELETNLEDKETELKRQRARHREIELEKAQGQSTLEQGRLATEGRRGDLNDIQRDIDCTLMEHRQHLADRVQIDLLFSEKESATKRAAEAKARAIKAQEEEMRQVHASNKILESFKSQLLPLETTIDKLKAEKNELSKKMDEMERNRIQLKKEEDLSMSDFLKIEAEEGSVDDVLQQVIDCNKRLESEMESHRSIEQAHNKMLQTVMKQRDHLLRTLSHVKRKHREAENELVLKEKALADADGLYKEKEKQRSDFQALYDLMKNERNRFVHHIQIGRHATEELESKVKLLEEELACQREKHEAKSKEIEDAQNQRQAVIEEHEALKAEYSQLSKELDEKLALVEREGAGIDNCLCIINRCEKEMTAAKVSLETILQNRNFTGLLLIDRNDELCVLYEKSNLHLQVQQQGELEMKKKDDELRMLKIQTADLKRSIAASKKAKEEIPEIDKEVAWLRCQLLQAKKDVEDRSRELENSADPQRWRDLEGVDFEPEQLEAKIRQLQGALDAKQEQTTQRSLVLDEIQRQNQTMESHLQQSSVNGIKLGRSLVKQELRNEELNLKLKAKAAEIVVYKGMAHDLAKQRDALRAHVEEAKLRFAAGQAPSDEIEKEWDQIQRHQSTIQKLLADQKCPLDRPVDEIPSHCEPRPNAYIPDDLGIPRPFGMGAFKPTPAGATMRHMKKSNIPDVVL